MICFAPRHTDTLAHSLMHPQRSRPVWSHVHGRAIRITYVSRATYKSAPEVRPTWNPLKGLPPLVIRADQDDLLCATTHTATTRAPVKSSFIGVPQWHP